MSQPRLHISGSRSLRPHAHRVVFCDGSRDDTYRQGLDLELSHWVPNTTPARFKADTSTEICLRCVAAGEHADFDLVINNHVDVDGVLSTFVLLHPELSLQHCQTLVQAAEMGDFSGCGTADAQHLFQALVCAIATLEAQRVDPLEIYQRCYERTLACLSGTRFAECDAGLAALQASIVRIEAGSIVRTLVTPRLVHYHVALALTAADPVACLQLPGLNEPLSPGMPLLPHARARFDRERVQLVSTELADGIYYDLWYPGYVWADTVSLWRAPGVLGVSSINLHSFQYPQLAAAVAELRELETAAGEWILATELSAFVAVPGRGFPVVLAFMKDGAPAPSALPGSRVAGVLAPAFAMS